MTFASQLILALSLAQAQVVQGSIETFSIPHWISLVPQKLETKINELEKSAQLVANEKCAKERAEFWDLQMKASELAAVQGANAAYVEAADLAEKASARERDCRKAHLNLENLKFEFDLHADPDKTSRKIGKLRLEVRPWNPESESSEPQVKTVFVDLENAEREFLVDIPHPFNEKLGAYHTILARQGGWLKLPQRPFPSPVWVDFSEFAVEPAQSILKVSRPVFVNTGETATYVVFTKQNKHQMIGVETDENRGRAPSKAKIVTVNLADLFDADGHIRAKWRPEG